MATITQPHAEQDSLLQAKIPARYIAALRSEAAERASETGHMIYPRDILTEMLERRYPHAPRIERARRKL